jgi:hypothetical protein
MMAENLDVSSSSVSEHSLTSSDGNSSDVNQQEMTDVEHDVDNDQEIRPFQFDPRMTADTKRQRDEEDQRQQTLIETRNLSEQHWCKCGECVAQINPLENICCTEDEHVKKFLSSEVSCITIHEGFAVTTLNIHVLGMVRAHLLHILKDKAKTARLGSNAPDTMRHLAYVNFRSWICRGKKLGRGYRIITPACVVHRIRQKWPEPSGQYTGFRAINNNLDDL